NDKTTKIDRLSSTEAEKMILEGKATGGMVPKLENLVAILRRGVRSAHVIGGTQRNGILAEVFTDEGLGTMITAE
ncbi:hypothetical protein OFM36_29930, partial [Escherichia coli]|nr:hypothetical protein [Escherichia coli]